MQRLIRMLSLAIVCAAASAGLLPAPALAAPSAGAGAAASAAAGDVDDFVFSSLDVEYTLTRAEDGMSHLRVVETFVAEFPTSDQNRGMRRSIPDSYLGTPLFPSLVSVTDGAGAERPVETESDDGYLVVTSRAEDFVHGSQTYVFTYDLQNVTRTFADTADEFYWDVNGEEWAQPFGEVTARVVLAPDLASALTGDRACYAGATGSADRCEISAVTSTVDGGVVVEAAATDLAPFETMTIAVGFEPGTFTAFDSSPLASPFAWWQGVSVLGAVGAVVWAAFARRRLRDEPGRPVIIAEYTPSPDVDALEAAVLLGRTGRGIPAEVLEQAIAGSIGVVEGKRRWAGATYELQLIDRARADENGRELLDGFFPPGRTTFTLGRSDSRVSRTAQKILSDADTQLKKRGLRRAVPGGLRGWPVFAAVLAALGAVAFGVAAIDTGVRPLWPIVLMIVGALSLVVVAGMVSRRPLSARGAEVRDHLRGLQMFIEWAEADRIRMLQSPTGAKRAAVSADDPRQVLRLYERLLPYAVVFGQEKEWASELAVRYGDEAPDWYFGHAAFNAAAFSSSVSALSSSASSSTASSSGGSTGGGSAGGGGGGGGGGGV